MPVAVARVAAEAPAWRCCLLACLLLLVVASMHQERSQLAKSPGHLSNPNASLYPQRAALRDRPVVARLADFFNSRKLEREQEAALLQASLGDLRSGHDALGACFLKDRAGLPPLGRVKTVWPCSVRPCIVRRRRPDAGLMSLACAFAGAVSCLLSLVSCGGIGSSVGRADAKSSWAALSLTRIITLMHAHTRTQEAMSSWAALCWTASATLRR
jgi:hypothetical protein